MVFIGLGVLILILTCVFSLQLTIPMFLLGLVLGAIAMFIGLVKEMIGGK